MKKLILICSFIAASFTSITAQTYVKGGIYSSTTWTAANSPYIVTDTIVIFSGVTLTIQPGVTVKFYNNQYIDVRGSLYANGTPGDSIIFTSNSATPKAGIWAGIGNGTTYTYCGFYYANIALNGTSGSNPIAHCNFSSCLMGIQYLGISVDTCNFSYDSIGIQQSNTPNITYCNFFRNGIGIFQGSPNIYYSTFSQNNYGIRNINSGIISNCTIDSNRAYGLYIADDPVRNCTISYNGVGIEDENGSIELCTISYNNIGIEMVDNELYSCNSICNNKKHSIINDMTTNVSVKNNYWCLPDSASIESTIYDGRTNLSLGLIFFTPFDTVACTKLATTCSLTAKLSTTSSTVCYGNSVTLTDNVTDGTSSYSVSWMPGSFTGVSDIVTPSANTTYTAIVTDSKGCKDTSFITIDTVYCPHTSGCGLYAYPTASSTSISACGSGTTLYANASDSTGTITSITWQPGGLSGSSVTVSPSTSTTYSLSITDNHGCTYDSGFVTIFVSGSIPTPSICYVTADTASQHNIVVWSKAGIDTTTVDSVTIYREVTTNNYVAVGSASIHGYTQYMDITSNPNNESYFYEIGVEDSCGSSGLSNPCETVFLQSNLGLGNVVNLSWNFYMGNPVNDYRILRDDSGKGNWHVIDSVPGNVNAYTDRNPPASPDLRYMLNTSWSLSCVPYLPAMMEKGTGRGIHYKFDTHNESYSNIANIAILGIDQVLDPADFDVYPNPASSELSISMRQNVNGAITVTNVLGQTVYTSTITGNSGTVQKIDISSLQQGVYFLKIESNGQVLTKKVLKI